MIKIDKVQVAGASEEIFIFDLSFLGEVVLEAAGGSRTTTYEAQATHRHRALSSMLGWLVGETSREKEMKGKRERTKTKYGGDKSELCETQSCCSLYAEAELLRILGLATGLSDTLNEL